MSDITVKCCLILFATLVGCDKAGGQDVDNGPKGEKCITVRAQDIPQSVQIIGRLGRPLGSLLRIRGKWIRPGIEAKDPTLVLHVDVVDGKKVDGVDLHGLQVDAILSSHKGRKPNAGELWDWRFDWGGNVPPPAPAEGETWEMMGVETGCFESYSEQAWQEIGPPAVQEPPFKVGFYTRFEYIAVRRVK